MSTQRRGLGRGLGALIPTGPANPGRGDGAESPVSTFLLRGSTTVPSLDRQVREAGAADGAATTDLASPSVADSEAPVKPEADARDGGAERSVAATEGLGYFAEIPLDRVVPNPRQPRQVFDDDALDELVHSIREIGLLQPVVVRPVGDDRFELVMGERRWRASQRAELATIPAIVRQTPDDQMLRDALLENLHRAALNPLEEAAAYGQLLDDFGCTQDQLAARIGRSRPQITNTLRLLKLPPAVQRRVAAGVLSAGHARALLGAPDAETADRLAHRVVAEGISVRALEELVALGDPSDGTAARQRRSKQVTPELAELADRLSDRYDTRVKVDMGRNRGRITIEFASEDDLERIIAMMDAPPPAAATTSATRSPGQS